MSSLTIKRLKQLIISSVTQPLKIGGTADDGSDAKITIDSSGVLNLDGGAKLGGVTFLDYIKSLFNIGGTAPMYACRAWVNFDGTGTPVINSSGNFTSITDAGVGKYGFNFTTAMPDVKYSFVGGVTRSTENDRGFDFYSISTTSFYMEVYNEFDYGARDVGIASVAVFR